MDGNRGYGGRYSRGGGRSGGGSRGGNSWRYVNSNSANRSGGRGVKDLSKAPDLRGHKDAIRGITCVAEGVGQGVYTAGQDGTVRVWDITAGKLLKTVDVGGDAQSILCAGGYLFVGVTNVLRSYNLTTGAQAEMSGHVGHIYALEASLEQGMIFSAGQDKIIRAWKYDEASQKFVGVGVLEGHTGTITCLLIAGPILLSGSNDSTIKVWNLATGSCIQTASGHNGAVMSMLLWSNHVISCALDGAVKVWAIAQGALRCNFTLAGSNGDGQNGERRARGGGGEPYRGAAMRMCGTMTAAGEPRLAVAYLDPPCIQMYSLPEFEDKGQIRMPSEALALHAMDGLFLTGDSGGSLKVWRWQQPQPQ